MQIRGWILVPQTQRYLSLADYVHTFNTLLDLIVTRLDVMKIIFPKKKTALLNILMPFWKITNKT